MLKIDWNRKYTTIAVYACIVITVAVAGLLIGINIKYLIGYAAALLNMMSPIIYGIIIAYICNPLLKLCEKYIFSRIKKNKPRSKIRRILSIILTYIIALIIISLFALLVVPQVISSYNDLQNKVSFYISSAQAWADDFVRNFPLFNGKYETIAEFIDVNDVTENIKEFITNSYETIQTITAYIIDYGGKFVITLSNSVLGIILSFYFLFAKEKIGVFIKKLMDSILPVRIVDKTIEIAKFTHKTFGRYILGQLLDSFLVAVVTFIVLGLFKMPFYPLVSVIVGVTNVIPYFGPYLGAIPSAFIIFIADPVKAFWFLVIILVIQQIDGNIICPRIIGDTTGLSSVWVIIAIIIMSGWLGVPGMFIGVPIFALIYHLFKGFIEERLRKKNLPTETSAYYDDKYRAVS